MPITNPLKEYVITGIKSLLFYDANGDFSVELDKLTDINLTDETASSELRGGLGNPVILTIKGDRTCKLSASSSTLSTDYIKLLTGNSVTTKTINTPKVDKKLAITSNTATLTKTPSAGANVTIYLSNANGENIMKLTKVASAPTTGQYSITGSVVTLASGTTGVINAYYFVSEEVEAQEATSGVTPTYSCKGVCLLTSTSNKRLYKGIIDMPNVQVSPSITLAGKNSSDAPDANTLELDLLSTGSYPYAIQAVEISTSNDVL